VPVQGCTLPLPYSRAIPLLPLRTVRPVQSLSDCTRVHFTFFLPLTASTISPFQCTKHSNQNVVWGVGARCYCHWSGTTIQTKRSFLRHTQRNVAFHPRVPKCHVEELIDLRSIFSRRTTKTDGGQKSKRSINCAERGLCLERILWRV
jgi:hypothetical protein